MTPLSSFRALCLCICLCSASLSFANPGQRPQQLVGVDIVENIGAKALTQATFTDHLGNTTSLDAFLQDGKPVILTLNYYRCKMLCSQQLNGLLNALHALPWLPGDRFRIVTVSIDPRETPALAAAKRQSYLDELGKGEVDWQFLTSDAANAQMLADSVGFGYQYDPATDQYAHVAALILLTSDGTIARYLYGIEYDPETLKRAILQTEAGQTVSSLHRPAFSCFTGLADTEAVSRRTRLIMQITCSATALAFGGFLAFWWRRDNKKHSAPES
jgi:protein SCO1/2